MTDSTYKVVAGPEGYLPPAAATMGVELPDPGQAIMEGEWVDHDAAMKAMAEKLISAENPTFFPGPLILWDWKPGVAEKAAALLALAEACDAKIIPMPDYRPKYPMINPEIEVNPNHPNLTIAHNKIDVCLFIGVHCHYANIALKIIRGGTSCYTLAICAEAGHEEANISLRDAGICELERLRELVIELKAGRK